MPPKAIKKAATRKVAAITGTKAAVKPATETLLPPPDVNAAAEFHNTGRLAYMAPTNEEKLKATFKNLHDEIVQHEMMLTKHRVERQLANEEYVPLPDAENMNVVVRSSTYSALTDLLIIGASCFIIGVLYGRKQIIREIQESM